MLIVVLYTPFPLKAAINESLFAVLILTALLKTKFEVDVELEFGLLTVDSFVPVEVSLFCLFTVGTLVATKDVSD